VLHASPLSAEAFAPFGEVLETEGRAFRWINAGTCKRYDDLAHIDVTANEGHPLVSVFEATPQPLPLHIRMLERHPLSSQAFVPLDGRRFLVVVARAAAWDCARDIHAFVTSGTQGVNLRRGTWHHPLIALGARGRFLVVDRGGPGANCEERVIEKERLLVDVP